MLSCHAAVPVCVVCICICCLVVLLSSCLLVLTSLLSLIYLRELAKRLDAFRRSFEYIQDYIHVYGLRLWLEEFSRVINYHVEQEANLYLKRSVQDEDSKWQSRTIPIPKLPTPAAPNSTGGKTKGVHNSHYCVNFMGRLALGASLPFLCLPIFSPFSSLFSVSPSSLLFSSLLHSTQVCFSSLSPHAPSALRTLTDWRITSYSPESSGWYDAEGKEIAGVQTFVEINRCVSVAGLLGMDRLNSFFISRRLSDFIRLYEVQLSKPKAPMREVMLTAAADLRPHRKLVGEHTREYYATTTTKGSKLWDALRVVVHDVGQAQLIRQKIANELQFRCQLDSSVLHGAISTLNTALLNDVRRHHNDPSKHPTPQPKGNPLLSDFSSLLAAAGMDNPLDKIYIVSKSLDLLPLALALLSIAMMQRFKFDKDFSTLVRKVPTEQVRSRLSKALHFADHKVNTHSLCSTRAHNSH